MKRQKRTYLVYRTMFMAMKRNGIKYPGPTTTILLEAFIELNGQIKASSVYAKKICVKNSDFQFKDWRKELVDNDWLRYEIVNNQTVIYSAGPKLVKYVNIEKIKREEIATKKDLRNYITKETFEAEMRKMRGAIESLIEEFDPPVTEEKVERRLSIVKDC